MAIHITTAQPTDPEVSAMLREHAREMGEVSPPESVHTLEPDELSSGGARIWAAWRDGEVVGVVALVPVADRHAELTSMRTVAAARRQGVGAALLARLLEEAAEAGFSRVSLETGADEFFEPARRLYERRGFEVTGPFGSYREDANSVFMTIEI
ncbi:MAG: GNAT family N-acetyltransferase [bacterium]|nr:GNAT family N-acetyltransferase [bacterium]